MDQEHVSPPSWGTGGDRLEAAGVLTRSLYGCAVRGLKERALIPREDPRARRWHPPAHGAPLPAPVVAREPCEAGQPRILSGLGVGVCVCVRNVDQAVARLAALPIIEGGQGLGSRRSQVGFQQPKRNHHSLCASQPRRGGAGQGGAECGGSPDCHACHTP